jgi:hypothetical protein
MQNINKRVKFEGKDYEVLCLYQKDVSELTVSVSECIIDSEEISRYIGLPHTHKFINFNSSLAKNVEGLITLINTTVKECANINAEKENFEKMLEEWDGIIK